MSLLYITWVRLVLTNVYNIFVPLDSSCEPNTLMVTDEYNSNCWRSIFLPAGCWSQNQWSAFRPLPLPSWQRFFWWKSASYSLCSNPPGAFANPADMRWRLDVGCTWCSVWVDLSPPLAPAPACYFLCSQTSGHWWGGTRLRGPASRVLTGIPATSVRLTSYSGNWSVAETPSGHTRRPVSSAPAALSSSGRSPAGTKPDRKAAAVSERLCPSTKKQSIDNPHQVWWWLAVATQVIRANFCSRYKCFGFAPRWLCI